MLNFNFLKKKIFLNVASKLVVIHIHSRLIQTINILCQIFRFCQLMRLEFEFKLKSFYDVRYWGSYHADMNISLTQI
jgi:hypothetical protein